MKKSILFTLIIVAGVLLSGCKKKYDIDLNLFKEGFVRSLNALDSTQKKFYTQIYDTANPQPLWFTSSHDFKQKPNIYNRYLSNVLPEHGINPRFFLKDSLQKILSEVDTLHFDYAQISKLDLLLSKSYYDYCSAMKYGCFDPRKIYPDEYFIESKRPDEEFLKTTFAGLNDTLSLKNYLASVQPQRKDYKAMQQRLKQDSTRKDTTLFWKIAANMERLRWIPVRKVSEKHVWVNVAAARLRMMRGDSTVEVLKVGVGKSGDHETPLLIGDIYQVVLNPTWTVPTSIVVNEIARKGGKIPAYIARNNMKIYKRGVVQDPCSIPWSTLTEKKQPYTIVQDSGTGNSLGRIKFNFDNPFAVYLHDTNSKYIFAYDRRDVSHGCVRVQNPLKLAFFCLNDIDTTNQKAVKDRRAYEDRIRVTIGMNPLAKSSSAIAKLGSSIILKPKVTVIIDYRTCYVDTDGKLAFTGDYYKMDNVLMKKLNNIPVEIARKEKKTATEPKKQETTIQKADSVKTQTSVVKTDSVKPRKSDTLKSDIEKVKTDSV